MRLSKSMTLSTYDLVGVGIGPSNMSLAALLIPSKQIQAQFFEQRQEFRWHGGMLLPDVYLQVPFISDLVTLVDPTNPYSFLAFLAYKKRLYSFINAGFAFALREEFNQYLQWASQILPNLNFAEKVEEIDFVAGKFIVRTDKRDLASQHVVLGKGIIPKIPKLIELPLDDKIYHCSDFLHRPHHWAGKSIAVIGGGQSSAEIVQSILSDTKNLPDSLSWISRRRQFLPLDDSPFTSEFFDPAYVQQFYHFSPEQRRMLLAEQSLASDGISLSTLQEIYQQMYKLSLLKQHPIKINLLPDHELKRVNRSNKGIELTITNLMLDSLRCVEADIVILCTGYQTAIPRSLAKIAHRIAWEEDKFKVCPDYSIQWDGPAQNRIYVKNAAQHTHGIADSNLCLIAWRSAVIINSIAGKPIYDIENEASILDWKNIYATSKDCSKRQP
jgi:lysine N6-hydroxylase